MRLFFLFACLFLYIGCTPNSQKYNKNPIKVYVPKGYSQKEVATEISAVLTGLKWQIDQTAESYITSHINHNGRNAKITLKFNTSEIIVLDNESTITMIDYNNKKMPPVTRLSLPYGWFRNIKRDIEYRFALAANPNAYKK